ncbi:MAG: nitrous oxide reductase accessory protein NosL [Zoogloea sp.]|uniref:nitrous oxide reductase accessory protein NosL n=1 Tax=Zoogloea sp. TaxID=49181 RepID=UPI001A3BBFE7|nr:nitrous oxide reductase accessory protein NosL [Zoogloea sp.]
MIPRLLCATLATTFLTLGLAPMVAAADLSPQYVQRSARCPVCGMYPYRSPQWMGQIVFNDQTASTFDSPVDMFRFLNNMVLFDKQHKPADVGAIWVADFGTKAWVDARKAFYVIGSKALGPMNDPNLPAFATREAADAHINAQGGKVMLFGEVTREVIKSLSGGQHRH